MSNYLKIVVRHDTLKNWLASNPILREDELAAVQVKKKLKFKKGDGNTSFKNLPFLRSLSDIGKSFCLYPAHLFNKVSIELEPVIDEKA